MKFIPENIKDQIEQYLLIQRLIDDGKLFTTPKFKKVFNKHYKIYQKSNDWLNSYYKVFMEASNNKRSFSWIMNEIRKKTGEIHPVFCSAIYASINPNKPIFQKYIIEWLGLVLKEPKDKDKEAEKNKRIEYYKHLYKVIDIEFNKHLTDKNVIEAIKKFDEEFPNASKISDVKKLEFMLLSIKDERRISIFEYNKLLDDYNELSNEKGNK